MALHTTEKIDGKNIYEATDSLLNSSNESFEYANIQVGSTALKKQRAILARCSKMALKSSENRSRPMICLTAPPPGYKYGDKINSQNSVVPFIRYGSTNNGRIQGVLYIEAIETFMQPKEQLPPEIEERLKRTITETFDNIKSNLYWPLILANSDLQKF